MEKSAILSTDRKYRYVLTRIWDETKQTVVFIGLNPSIADEETDDQTIRKCIGYSKRWGNGKLIMVNLFAFRSTGPSLLKRVEDPVGPEKDSYIQKYVSESDLVIACWGIQTKLLNRDKNLMGMVPNLFCLQRNKNGTPHHPLYLSNDITPVPYN